MTEEKRASVTAEELQDQLSKLTTGVETKEGGYAKEKPDEMDLAGAKKRLSNVETLEKVALPTAEDIKAEASGETTAAAEAALQEGKESLKAAETTEKQHLPTADDINAERNVELEAAEILTEAKRKLSSASTEEKQTLPTAEDIQAEKKDKACAVLSSEQMAKAAASKKAAEEKGAGLGTVDQKSLMVGGAGAGGGFGLNAPGFGVKVQHFAGGGSGVAAKKQLEVSPEVASTWQNVLDDASKKTWIYCKYSDDLKKLELQASGEGGLSEFKAQIGEELAWGGFRCYGVDKRGGTEVRRTKFIFVQVRPQGVSMVKKGKQSAHKNDVKESINNTHLDVGVESLADLDEQGLISKLQAATGAHKPNGYEFEPGVFVEADFYGLGIGKACKGETAANS
jgi:hypothetical protein